jgi:sugar phosphate isomerase/epimerase
MSSEYIYGGNVYSNDPNYKLNPFGIFTGVNLKMSEIGTATDARTANQIKEVSEMLNTGLKSLEVGPVQTDVFESIPKEHFKEMNRAAKLAGAELTFHAPMIDPTGITQHGWDKMTQQGAEKQLWDAIQKSHDVNPNGAVVTFHASSAPLPADYVKIKDEKGNEKIVSMLLVNRSDGKIAQVKAEERYFESEGGKKIVEFDPKKEIDRINTDNWMQRVNQVTFYAERGDDAINSALSKGEIIKGYNEAKLDPSKAKDHQEEIQKIEQMNRAMQKELDYGTTYLKDSYRNLRELYDDVYKGSTPEQKKVLENYSVEVKKVFDEYKKNPQNEDSLKSFAEAIRKGTKIMESIQPQMYESIHNFAVEKAAETTSNLALNAYKEFGKEAPIIALENHPAQQSILSTGEDLRDVITKARSEFVKKAVESKTLSESEAKKQAEKLIGATWDVGHINMMRKYGYGEEELLKQAEAVAPFVKKMHLSDNFGYEHTELPMGMGNVPFKKIMDKIGKEGYDIKKVIEAGNWWQHFSQGSKALGPIVPSLAGLGVPVYSAAYGAGNPGWNQMYGMPGGYFSGFGTMLPDQNFQMYGAGFSSLPSELGGQAAGGRDSSRMTGTPMA